MPYVIDATALDWQQGTFSSYNLAAGTPFYQYIGSPPNPRRVVSSPLTIGKGKCVIEANIGYMVQVYLLDDDMKYLGADSFHGAAQSTTILASENADFAAVCFRRTDDTNTTPEDAENAIKSITFPDIAGGGASMTNPITVTYDDFALWETNGAFNNGLAAGKTLAEVNYTKSGKRIALCELHEVPADSMTVTIAEGFQFAATYFDSDGLYLGGRVGHPGNSAWSSATERTVNRPASAKYWCVYLRRGAGTSELLPEHVMDACLAVTFDAGGAIP